MSPSAREARPLRVALDARLVDGEQGGVQQTILGLAHGLSQLADGDETYLFLAFEGAAGWLREHLRGPCRLLPVGPSPPPVRRDLRSAAQLVARLGPVRRSVERGFLGRFVEVRLPPSDGSIERAGAQVMHFTTQAGFVTEVPSLYVPHDLQHLHRPEYFSPFERRWRAAMYGPMAARSRLVVALSRWGRQDLVRGLGLSAEKIPVIGWAPILDAYPEPTDGAVAEVARRLRLPERFALYPAQTWRHKNHLGLLEALALLRDREGLEVPVVCTGRKNDFFPAIERRARALRLQAQLRFPGFVSPLDLRCLYRAARLLVFPSEFEGFGMPVIEAFRAGLPVVCSDAASLPELGGDAALRCDPSSAASIAAALGRAWRDEPLRAELAARGARWAAPLSWRGVALRYRALYRLIAGRALGDADRALVAECLA
jgi:glycosyltransferase involved in cell wall biosynthesis